MILINYLQKQTAVPRIILMDEMTAEHIDRIWSSLSHWLPEKTKVDAGVDFINCLQEIGVEDSVIKQAAEFDPKYEEAVLAVVGQDDDMEDTNEDWYYDSEGEE